MNISNSNQAASLYTQSKSDNAEVRKQEVDDLKDVYAATKLKIKEDSLSFTSVSFSTQSSALNPEAQFQKDYEEFQSFLGEIGYDGPNIGDLTQDEAKDLVSEDGFFGVTQTSERIANFVLAGAGSDEGLLRAGREGILRGFDEAETMSGGELPDISHQTIAKAVEIIDKAMHGMGYSILDSDA